jgi:hypothetical protein
MSDMIDGVNPAGAGGEETKSDKLLKQILEEMKKSSGAQLKMATELTQLKKLIDSSNKRREARQPKPSSGLSKDNKDLKDIYSSFTKDQRKILSDYDKKLKELHTDIKFGDRLIEATRRDFKKMQKYNEWVLKPENRKEIRKTNDNTNRNYLGNMAKYNDAHAMESFGDYFLGKSKAAQLLLGRSVRGPGSRVSQRNQDRSYIKGGFQKESDVHGRQNMLNFATGNNADMDHYYNDVEDSARNEREQATRAYHFRTSNREAAGAAGYNTKRYGSTSPGGGPGIYPGGQNFLPYPTESQIEKKLTPNRKKSKARPTESDVMKLPEAYGVPALYLGELLYKILDVDKETARKSGRAGSSGGGLLPDLAKTAIGTAVGGAAAAGGGAAASAAGTATAIVAPVVIAAGAGLAIGSLVKYGVDTNNKPWLDKVNMTTGNLEALKKRGIILSFRIKSLKEAQALKDLAENKVPSLNPFKDLRLNSNSWEEQYANRVNPGYPSFFGAVIDSQKSAGSLPKGVDPDTGEMYPKFHAGGIVPGPRGKEVSITAKAGERISAPGTSASIGEDSASLANNTQATVEKLSALIELQNQLLAEMRNNTKVTERSAQTSGSSGFPSESRKFVGMVQ